MATEKKILKKLGVLSLAKMEGGIMAVIGLIIGIIFTIVGTIMGGDIFGRPAISAIFDAGLGFLLIIIVPILYAVAGFILGAIGAFLYNIIAERIGGVEMDFE